MSKGITSWTNRIEILQKHWTNVDEIPEYRLEMIKYVVEELKLDKDKTIMDCGCGTGLLLKYLPDEYKNRYWGIDFTGEMIDYCRKEHPEYKNRFRRMDLTNMTYEDNKFFNGHSVYVTQNVIQHILLFQEALHNVFYACDGVILLCERTHQLNTCIVGYEPAYRWRFNVKDLYDVLKYYKECYGYMGDVEILGQPVSTAKREKALTIFRINRHNTIKLSKDTMTEYNNLYFYREKTIIRKAIPRLRRKQRLINFFKKIGL